ncbi:methyltransferase domain-containing protein [Candidatus Bathyarchaeota archaeon]|nr:methyltransferase domain-containing protein [Candidatus Bathyarchaeota archaeon]
MCTSVIDRHASETSCDTVPIFSDPANLEGLEDLFDMSLLGKIADWKRLELILSQISRNMTILDLGCGNGWLVEALRRMGFNIIGIDPNLPPLECYPSYLLKRNAYETGFPDDSFDCIVLLETIEHLEPRVYVEIRRIIRDRGKLIITTHKKRWNWLIETLSLMRLADSLGTPHINLVEPSQIPFQLQESGSFMYLEWYGIYKVIK